jgi:hypothetical protein
MDQEGLRAFLKRGGRSPSALERAITYVREFERYLQEYRAGKGLDEAMPEDLEAYVAWVERTPKASAKSHLWAIRYYYEYSSNDEMRRLCGALREQRIKRKPFALGKFRGVNPEYVDKLEAVGIRDVDQILHAGRTQSDRQKLSEKTGVPLEAILEFVKLSDLSRIGAVKRVRARLYYDAGVDTVEKMAQWDPGELRAMLIDFVERTGFDGIAPLPKEAQSAVAKAKTLRKIVKY